MSYIPISQKLASEHFFNPNEKMVLAYLLKFKKRVLYLEQQRTTEQLHIARNTLSKTLHYFDRAKLIKYVQPTGKRYKYIIIRNEAIVRYANYSLSKLDNNISWLKDSFTNSLATAEIEEMAKWVGVEVGEKGSIMLQEALEKR